MTRRMQFVTLSLIVGISVVFGMLIESSLFRVGPATAEAASAFALPATAAPSISPAGVPSFADIAERANPAVVAIRSLEVQKVRSSNRGFDPFFQFFFDPNANPHQRRRPSPHDDEQEPQGEGDDQTQENFSVGGGSGFIIRKDGYILTNNHVVDKSSKLTVTLDNGETYTATVKGKDEGIDLALLKIDCKHDLPVLPLGDSDALRIGEWVIAIGNPLGSDLGAQHSVTVGVVSAKGRQLKDLEPDYSLGNYIQTDAAINFGNSGGPLVDSRGEVIGINTAIERSYNNIPGLIEGIGFALPINQAKGVLDQLMATGKVSRGALGIKISAIDKLKQQFNKLPSQKGAFVEEINPGGPADRAGIKAGDVILSVDGKEIADNPALITMISSHKPGDTVSVGIWRDDREMSLKVKLVDRKETLAADRRGESGQEENEEEKPATAANLGFSVTELTPSLLNRMGIPKDHPEGVVVTKVAPGSNAFEAGIQPGELITQIGKDPISSLSDFKRATEKVKKGEVVRVTVSGYNRGNNAWDSRFAFFEAE